MRRERKTYLFILQTDDCEELIGLRRMLLKSGMPCGMFTERDFDEGRVADRVCIVSGDPNRAMMIASSVAGMEVILYSDRMAVLPNIHRVTPGENSIGCILETFGRIHEDRSLAYTPGRVFFANGIPYFRGQVVHLTPTETLILRHLAMNRGRFVSAPELSEYCFAGKGRSPTVHICNINKQVRKATARVLIETVRFSGYRVL